MREGLNIVATPSGYSPYVVIAWCRISDGWITYAPGHRVIRRFGTNSQLSKLASEGPIDTTQLLDPSKHGGGCSTAIVCRFEVCDPDAWREHCPRPADW